MASCSRDKKIKIWKSNPPYNLLKKLYGHNDSVISIIQLKRKEKLISAGIDSTVRIWNPYNISM